MTTTCWARITIILLIVWVAVSSAGCWSRKEIEDIGFVLSIGVDHAAEPGEIMITVHIAKPFAISTGVAGAVDEKPSASKQHRPYCVRGMEESPQSPRRPLYLVDSYV